MKKQDFITKAVVIEKGEQGFIDIKVEGTKVSVRGRMKGDPFGPFTEVKWEQKPNTTDQRYGIYAFSRCLADEEVKVDKKGKASNSPPLQ